MLKWSGALHGLGVAEMDRTHEDFTRLLNATIQAGDDDFPHLLNALVEHTRAHFDNESRLMRSCNFPAIAEHEGEHRRVLGELLHMRNAVTEGRIAFARLYVRQGLPDWFRNHLATMDAALAARLRQAGQAWQAASVAPAPGKPRASLDRVL